MTRAHAVGLCWGVRMPYLFDTETRVDTLVTAINVILGTDGQAGLTLRTIGRVSGVSPSSMLGHLGSREHLLRVAAHRTGEARRDHIAFRLHQEGAAAFLPENSSRGLLAARAWLGWCELGRSTDYLHSTVSRARIEERAMLATTLGTGAERHLVDGLMAMVDGLTQSVCQPVDPLELAEARAILEDYARAAASAAARSLPTISSGSSAE
jgi:AcrR family transcriptional regulator